MKSSLSPFMMISLLAGLAAIGLASFIFMFQFSGKSQQGAALVVPAVKLGGAFEMTDHTGQRVSEADFLGQYSLIYFGYSYCPDVCPTELGIVTRALQEMEDKDPAIAAKIIPVFVTLDPERDHQQLMAEYVDNFHPRMVGLTGSLEDLEKIAAAYRVFYAYGAPDEDGDYLVDHSSFLYFMGPDGQYRTMFRHNSNPLEIARQMTYIIQNEN